MEHWKIRSVVTEEILNVVCVLRTLWKSRRLQRRVACTNRILYTTLARAPRHVRVEYSCVTVSLRMVYQVVRHAYVYHRTQPIPFPENKVIARIRHGCDMRVGVGSVAWR